MKWNFWRTGDPFIWLTGGALACCLLMITGLIGIILNNGLGVFWPKDIELCYLQDGRGMMGEKIDRQLIPDKGEAYRLQYKIGNRDVNGLDFSWIDESEISSTERPENVVAFERFEWGNAYGFLQEVHTGEKKIAGEFETLWKYLNEQLILTKEIAKKIHEIEDGPLANINRQMEDLRLSKIKNEASSKDSDEGFDFDKQIEGLWEEYDTHAEELQKLRELNDVSYVTIQLDNGSKHEILLSQIVRVYLPNNLDYWNKLLVYFERVWEFVLGEPRESNTEGGIFPALFGTVMMVFLMSLAAVPFGILAALYLREYAKQGFIIRTIRIAVNNLAGVPSIVFGMFGLGFFVYGIGGSIDRIFYPELLPTPTFGTGGILWASLTLALLTVPVVIVSTEEALSSVPREIREGSLALGSTKFQMIWSVVLPSALPGILTGVILATARGAGEVAPLMITGVVKLAPDLPLDTIWPFFHLERKFMHLGFHIYDVGFQSPNVEAARPMVFTTALLLLLIVLLLNLTAIVIRNRLRKKYATSAF